MSRLFASLSLVVVVLALALSSAHAETTIIAVSGDSPPRGTGTFAEGLGVPVLNDNGEAVFVSNLRDGGFISGGGIFRSDGAPAGLTVIMLNGDPTPDANGNIGQADNATPFLRINSQDQVAALVSLTNTLGGGLDAWAIYRGEGGELTEIARLGESVPGNDGTFGGFHPYPTTLNDDGQVAFFAILLDTPDNAAVYRGDGATTTEIVRIHRVAPGSSFTFATIDGERVALNASGQVLFSGSGTGESEQAFQGIFRGDGAATIAIARQGDTAPDGNGTYILVSSSLAAFNDAGQAVFASLLQNTDLGAADNAGIFRSDGSTAVTIARKGAFTPGDNGRYLQFTLAPVINGSGHVLFRASISGASGGSDDGLFIGDGAATTAVARVNDPAPRGGRFSHFGAYALNDAGQAAFYAEVDLEDGGGVNDTFGLYFYDPVLGLLTVARKGDQLADIGVIGPINFAGGPTSRSKTADGINDQEQVAFQCFAGEKVAVAVWTKPDGTTTTTTTTTTLTTTTTTPISSSTTTTTLPIAHGCGRPVSTGANPTASDCLFILRTSVGSATCSPLCICNVNGDSQVTATDALVCLKKAVGQDVALNCFCAPR